MADLLLLVWHYLRFHRIKTTIMVLSIMLILYLPLAVYLLVNDYHRTLTERADSTPIVIGPRGNRFDLVFHALYFRAEAPSGLTMAEMQAVNRSGLARAIGLHCRFTARDFPIVGTSIEYFEFRDLKLADGNAFALLGDCVLGAEAARRLQLGPGDTLMSDPVNIFDIAGEYPLNMRVCGVLEPSGTADDQAVFVDVKTSWVIQGLGHGHEDVSRLKDPSVLLSRNDTRVVAGAALKQYMEINSDNIDQFHFHGEPDGFPLTGLICLPADEKAAALLAGRWQDTGSGLQLLQPHVVVRELFELVFRIKRFFDANMVLVSFSTALLSGLVVLLSLQLRRSEMNTLYCLGCSRGTAFKLQAFELLTIFALALCLALALSALTLLYGHHWTDLFFAGL